MRRSLFLGSATAIAAAAFLRDVGLAADLQRPPASLVPLIEALLPFESPAFPEISAEALAARVEALFGLDTSAVFQDSLRSFCALAAFPIGDDAAAFARSGLSPSSAFSELSLANRRAYLRLWSRSSIDLRRRFYGSVRAVAFVAFYSMPEAWAAIGYAGPLLGGPQPS